MNGYLRQSTAAQVRTIGPFVSDSDFKTLSSALTIANTDIKLKKNGAASASKNSGGGTADGTNGLYQITLDATDTSAVGELSLSVKVAGALVYFANYTVLTAAAYDSNFASTATGYVTDQPVNVTKWAGSATAAGNVAIKTTLAKTTDITGFNDISTANVQTELTTYGAVKPTTAGRTLDITATGEAGIDWANIGAPTTAQTLSATTISTSQVAASVTAPVTLTAAYDPAKTAAQAGAAMTLTAGERTTLTGVIWQALTSGLTTVGSIGKLIVDNLNATVSSAVGDTPGTTTLLSRIASALTITAGKVDVNDKTGFSLVAAYDPAKTCMQAGASVTVGTNNDKVGYSLTAAYDPAKTAAQVGSAMTLTAAYDPAKTASTQASVNTVAGYVDTEVGAIKVVTDKLDTALELDGAVWRYTVNALEQAPVGGGGGATDWTDPERQQIRHRLGLDGTAAAPAATPSLARPGDAMALTSGERTTLTGVIWNTLTSALSTVGSIGKLLVDNINASISSRSTYAGGDTAGTTTLLSRIASALTITAGKVDVNDKTGFSLTAAYDPAKTAMQAGSTVTLTAAYDAAKTAASPAQVTTALNTYGALKPTVAGTTLDITAGGCAGIDWANIENSNTYRELLGTYMYNVAYATNVNFVSQTAMVDSPVTTTKDAAIDSIKLSTDNLGTAMEVDGAVYRFTTNALEQAPVSTGGGGGGATSGKLLLSDIWKWTTTVSASSGQIRGEITDWNNLTKLWINYTNNGGGDLSTWLRNIQVGDTIRVQQFDDATVWNSYLVIGTPVDNGTWTEVPVSHSDGGGTQPPVSGKNCTVAFFREVADVDWTVAEKEQIRYRLGIDGDATLPIATPNLATQTSVNAVKVQTDNLRFTGTDVKATLDGELVTLVPAYDAAKGAMQAGPVTLTAAYDAAKTASSQSSVNGVKVVTDKLDTTMELDPDDSSIYRFTANALEEAPASTSGGGGNGGGGVPPVIITGDTIATTVGPTTEPPLKVVNPLQLRKSRR